MAALWCDHLFFSNMSAKRLIGLGLLAIMLQGCCGYRTPEFVNIDKVDVKEVSLKYVTADIDATLYNPGKHDITIESAELDVLLADKKAGILTVANQNTIQAKSEAKCNFAVKISTKEALKAGITSVEDIANNKAKIRLKGKVTGKYWFFRKKLNVDTTLKP